MESSYQSAWLACVYTIPLDCRAPTVGMKTQICTLTHANLELHIPSRDMTRSKRVQCRGWSKMSIPRFVWNRLPHSCARHSEERRNIEAQHFSHTLESWNRNFACPCRTMQCSRSARSSTHGPKSNLGLWFKVACPPPLPRHATFVSLSVLGPNWKPEPTI